jgi:hypothetical protein
MRRRSVPGAPPRPAEPLEQRAYRAAGHQLMDYLLRHGQAKRFLPMDRAAMLPDRRHITVNGDGTHWAERTAATGSLLTVPQVLLAGVAAERRKFSPADRPWEAPSPWVDKARTMLIAYCEPNSSAEAPDAARIKTDSLLTAMQADVARQVRRRWRAVERVAKALIQRRTLEIAEADELVRRGLLRSTLAGSVVLGLESVGRLFRGRPARRP